MESLGESTNNGSIPQTYSSSSSDESSSSSSTTTAIIQRYLRELSSIVNNPTAASNKEMSLYNAAANCNSTIIENAIKYMKQLQERVKSLEEQACQNDQDPDHDHERSVEKSLPEVKAKTHGKDVLISIICENQKGYVTKTISEIEKLRLTVADISALPFGDYFFTITVSAQMGNEISLTAKEIKRNLRQALLEFM